MRYRPFCSSILHSCVQTVAGKARTAKPGCSEIEGTSICSGVVRGAFAFAAESNRNAKVVVSCCLQQKVLNTPAHFYQARPGLHFRPTFGHHRRHSNLAMRLYEYLNDAPVRTRLLLYFALNVKEAAHCIHDEGATRKECIRL